MPEATKPGLAGRIAFTYPDFIYFQTARMFVVMAQEMQSVAVGWQIYEITKRPLDLGYVGLAQFLPGILLFLASGQVADHFDRRKLLTICYGGIALCSGLLLRAAVAGVHSVFPIYLAIVLLGVARSFTGPASRALLPLLVPEEHFSNAVAWGATFFQTATIVGPALGGVIYAVSRGPAAVYGTAMLTAIAALFLTLRIKPRPPVRRREPVNLKSVLAGLRYTWSQKLILGSISLDLFAVLLGGATALLPVYARDILRTGPWGLGLLLSANGIGAGAMAILIAYRPLRRAGSTMLWCVAGFGVFTIVFGISRNLILSMAALVLVGATDMVSVVVRATLVQLATPDAMRGRVNAVDMVFIGASNDLGRFESGVTAHWFGTVPAVVLGGLGTILVTAIWAWRFPELRKVDSLTNLNV